MSFVRFRLYSNNLGRHFKNANYTLECRLRLRLLLFLLGGLALYGSSQLLSSFTALSHLSSNSCSSDVACLLICGYVCYHNYTYIYLCIYIFGKVILRFSVSPLLEHQLYVSEIMMKKIRYVRMRQIFYS